MATKKPNFSSKARVAGIKERKLRYKLRRDLAKHYKCATIDFFPMNIRHTMAKFNIDEHKIPGVLLENAAPDLAVGTAVSLGMIPSRAATKAVRKKVHAQVQETITPSNQKIVIDGLLDIIKRIT